MSEIEAACARLRAAGVSPDPISIARREADEDEWRDVWKKYFRALRVGRSFVIRPELGRAARGGRRSGDRHRSGARLRHGRSRVDAAGDRDGRGAGRRGRSSASSISAAGPGSCRSRRRCCGRRRAGWRWTSIRRRSRPPTRTWRSTGSRRSRRASAAWATCRRGNDLVLANIEASVLVPLAPEFPARVAPGGALILSGLLAERRRRRDARLSRRRLRASTRAATRTSGRRCACRSARRGEVSARRLFVPPDRLRATPHHRRRRRAPSPGARAARAAGRRDHAVRRRGRRGRARASSASGATRPSWWPTRPGRRPRARRRGRETPLRAADRRAARWAHGLPGAEDAASWASRASCPSSPRVRSCVPSRARRARWEKIAREAARQCGRADVPAVVAADGARGRAGGARPARTGGSCL